MNKANELLIKSRQNLQSKETLITMVDKVNKNEVIDYAFNYINNYAEFENIKNYVLKNDNPVLMTIKPFLEEVYDEVIKLSKVNYGNLEIKDYLLSIRDYTRAIPLGFDEFVSIIDINQDIEIMDFFILMPYPSLDIMDDFFLFAEDDRVSTEFFINVPINKNSLDLDDTELVAKCILQLAYIKEFNLINNK